MSFFINHRGYGKSEVEFRCRACVAFEDSVRREKKRLAERVQEEEVSVETLMEKAQLEYQVACSKYNHAREEQVVAANEFRAGGWNPAEKGKIEAADKAVASASKQVDVMGRKLSAATLAYRMDLVARSAAHRKSKEK